ncbi:MAG: glycosyltransferase family 4 protein [Hyphomicrobiaceae bacterium]
MPACAFLIPGDINLPTGGYAYDRHLLERFPLFGVDVAHVPLPAGFPAPTDEDLAETTRVLAAITDDAVLLIDGLAYGAMPEIILQAIRQPIVALCHHPLGLEPGLTPEMAERLLQSERIALAHAKAVIVSGDETRGILADRFAVPLDKLTVAVPGVSPMPRATGTGTPLALLAVGSIVPRKGYGGLIAALAGLKTYDWRLTIAGADDRHPNEPRHLRRLIAQHQLTDRIELAGAVDEPTLAHLYAQADVFILSSLYEGYGMVLSEAMMRGLPIVTTQCGSAARDMPDSAALKVQPGNVGELAGAIERTLANAELRGTLARASWLAGQQLPRWDETVATVVEVIRKAAA